MKPISRRDGVLKEEVDGETLVYDPATQKVHCLNGTALWVWEHCDGTLDLPALARMAEKTFAVEAPEEVMGLALERLAKAGLLEDLPELAHRREPTRREALRRLAKVGLALPVVMTVATPTPAQAATMITAGDCWADARANEGKCCTNGRRCRRFGRVGLCWGDRC